MDDASASLEAETRLVDIGDAEMELTIGPPVPGAPTICTSHPAVFYAKVTAGILAELSAARSVCVNVRGIGRSSAITGRYTLEAMVDDIEAVRHALGLPPWVFWGMSGW